MISIIDNKYVYIPFLVFYEDQVIFAYDKYEDKDWSITHMIEQAYQSENFDLAKKAFSKCLRVLCPKELWKKHGVIKANIGFLQEYIPNYRTDNHFGRSTYLEYSNFIKHFEVLDLDKNILKTSEPIKYQQISIFEL